MSTHQAPQAGGLAPPSTGPQPATVRDHSHAPNQASPMLSDSHPLTAPCIAEAVGPLPNGVAQGKHHLNHILGSQSCPQTEGTECSPFRQRVHRGGRAALSSDTTRGPCLACGKRLGPLGSEAAELSVPSQRKAQGREARAAQQGPASQQSPRSSCPQVPRV